MECWYSKCCPKRKHQENNKNKRQIEAKQGVFGPIPCGTNIAYFITSFCVANKDTLLAIAFFIGLRTLDCMRRVLATFVGKKASRFCTPPVSLKKPQTASTKLIGACFNFLALFKKYITSLHQSKQTRM